MTPYPPKRDDYFNAKLKHCRSLNNLSKNSEIDISDERNTNTLDKRKTMTLKANVDGFEEDGLKKMVHPGGFEP
ncbi:hypothetical protein, partial [Dickeya solani]|uniref:hypothetical protein n=4 Tax=Dickeya solani TaxID=1089444 RepID=UPI0022A70438